MYMHTREEPPVVTVLINAVTVNAVGADEPLLLCGVVFGLHSDAPRLTIKFVLNQRTELATS